MNNIFTYLIELNVCFLAFFGLYFLLFRNLSFFKFNRVYLIFTVLFSLLLPLLNFEIGSEAMALSTIQLETIQVGVQSVENSIGQYYNVVFISSILYLIGCAFMTIKLLRGLWLIFKIKHKGISKNEGSVELVYSDKLESVASFFNKVFVPTGFDTSNSDNQKILIHEAVHCQQMHTVDLLLTEIFKIINWINPITLVLKKYTQLTHEYLADQATVEETKDVRNYAMLILQQSYPELSSQLTNQFNFSPVKKRIFMLQKRKSSQVMRWSYLSMLPIFALMILTFACQKAETDLNKADKNKVQEIDKTKAAVAEKVLASNESAVAEDEVFAVVEDPPIFPGGELAMMQFIYNNIKYPEEARKSEIEGMCVIAFIVEKDGSISNAEIVRNIGGKCGEEALRVVNLMPTWTAGKQRGENVRVKYNLPVRYKLS